MLDQFDEIVMLSPKRVIKVIEQPGTKMHKIQLTQLSSLSTIRDGLQAKIKRSIGYLRLFTPEGVELFEEDIQFLKEGGVVFASFDGEDFDSQESFKQYETIRLLGEGGFGTVVLAQHKISKQKVAIKIVRTSEIGNAEDIDMVFQEAETLKQLHHKNIVKILNCFSLTNMRVVFVMEYLEGGELLELVSSRGKISEAEARVYFIQIIDAMMYCHAQSLIHRDLKLENILLAQKNSTHVKIVDFGISGLASNFSVSKLDAGSLRYMAPEILMKKARRPGPHIDVWACGVILYGMVFGKLPFEGYSNEELIENICSLNYTIPYECTPELRDLLNQIFNEDHFARISMAEISRHPFCDPHKKLSLVIRFQQDSINETVQAKDTPRRKKSSPQRVSFNNVMFAAIQSPKEYPRSGFSQPHLFPEAQTGFPQLKRQVSKEVTFTTFASPRRSLMMQPIEKNYQDVFTKYKLACQSVNQRQLQIKNDISFKRIFRDISVGKYTSRNMKSPTAGSTLTFPENTETKFKKIKTVPVQQPQPIIETSKMNWVKIGFFQKFKKKNQKKV